MKRPIDGDAVKRRTWDIAEAWKDQGRNYEALLLESVIEQIVDTQPTLTPPNEPLTLEQLRKMKDEPAYLKVFDPRLESGWHIIEAVTENKIIFRGWHTVYVPIDGMGVDYNLYRRQPEGEEET